MISHDSRLQNNDSNNCADSSEVDTSLVTAITSNILGISDITNGDLKVKQSNETGINSSEDYSNIDLLVCKTKLDVSDLLSADSSAQFEAAITKINELTIEYKLDKMNDSLFVEQVGMYYYLSRMTSSSSLDKYQESNISINNAFADISAEPMNDEIFQSNRKNNSLNIASSEINESIEHSNHERDTQVKSKGHAYLRVRTTSPGFIAYLDNMQGLIEGLVARSPLECSLSSENGSNCERVNHPIFPRHLNSDSNMENKNLSDKTISNSRCDRKTSSNLTGDVWVTSWCESKIWIYSLFLVMSEEVRLNQLHFRICLFVNLNA